MRVGLFMWNSLFICSEGIIQKLKTIDKETSFFGMIAHLDRIKVKFEYPGHTVENANFATFRLNCIPVLSVSSFKIIYFSIDGLLVH